MADNILTNRYLIKCVGRVVIESHWVNERLTELKFIHYNYHDNIHRRGETITITTRRDITITNNIHKRGETITITITTRRDITITMTTYAREERQLHKRNVHTTIMFDLRLCRTCFLANSITNKPSQLSQVFIYDITKY